MFFLIGVSVMLIALIWLLIREDLRNPPPAENREIEPGS